MPRLFTLAWPPFAKFEAALLLLLLLLVMHDISPLRATIEAQWTDQLATAATTSGISQSRLIWVLLAAGEALPALAVLVAADRIMGRRRGFAWLSLGAIAAWAAIAAALAPAMADRVPASIASGLGGLPFPASVAVVTAFVALLIHLRPLRIGLQDRGFVGIRLSEAAPAQARRRRWLPPNPRGRTQPPPRVGGMLPWWLVLGAAVAAYAYRAPLIGVIGHAVAMVAPSPGADRHEAAAMRDAGGRFVFDATVDGVAMPLVFDSDAAALTLRAEDAARLGLSLKPAAFSVRTRLSVGVRMVAPVTITALAFGGITLDHVEAFVARPGTLSENHLGQSCLARLKGYRVDRDRLVLSGG